MNKLLVDKLQNQCLFKYNCFVYSFITCYSKLKYPLWVIGLGCALCSQLRKCWSIEYISSPESIYLEHEAKTVK